MPHNEKQAEEETFQLQTKEVGRMNIWWSKSNFEGLQSSQVENSIPLSQLITSSFLLLRNKFKHML
jgi:hypothetical protein